MISPIGGFQPRLSGRHFFINNDHIVRALPADLEWASASARVSVAAQNGETMRNREFVLAEIAL